MDIAAALASAPSTVITGKLCLFARHYGSIPSDLPKYDQLVSAVEDLDEKGKPVVSADRLSIIFSRLGLPVSSTLIRKHRAHVCQCHGGRS